MGNCVRNSNYEETGELFSYRNTRTLKIKKKDFYERAYGYEKVDVTLDGIRNHTSYSVRVDSLMLNVSGGILPNFDPRGIISKDCQDYLFVSEQEECLLVGLFDGHGKYGLACVQFCSTFMTNFFSENAFKFKEDCENTMIQMFEESDIALKTSPEIDSTTSGSTAVLVCFHGSEVTCASVGDSRGIIGTVGKNTDTHSLMTLGHIIEPTREMCAVPITTDQKPHYAEELARITEKGGIVKQSLNSKGKKVGPYRVWRTDESSPGLAMSRSLGDSIASGVGVVATPIVHTFDIYQGTDQFLVIGSDGLWDTMSNTDVVNFVDKFRSKCLLQAPSEVEYPVRAESTTIGHFLAEEARLRWQSICEEEDIMIDDIGVLVVDFNSGPGTCHHLAADRQVQQFTVGLEEKPKQWYKKPS